MAINTGVPAAFSLEESNALISTLFASSMDGMALIAPDYRVRYANEQMAQMVKIPLEKALGYPIEDLIPVWSRQMDGVCQKIRLSGQPFTVDFNPFSFENQHEREMTYWKVKISPVHGTDGSFLGWVVTLRDVTQCKKNENEIAILSQDLENKITLLNKINENSLAGLAILDGVALTYKWVNKAFASFLNLSYPMNGFHGLSFEESIFPEQKNDWLAKLREVTCTRIPLRDSLLNQEQKYWNCSILPLFTHTDIPDLMIVVYDITEKILGRKQIEEYARRVDHHFRQLETIIENMSDGIVIFDLNGKILNQNSAAVQLLGYKDHRNYPVCLSQIQLELKLCDFEGNDLPFAVWPWNRIMNDGTVDNFELAVFRISTGEIRYLCYNGTIIKENNETASIGIMTIRDITQREILIRQLEQEQARLQAVLEQMPCGVIMFEASSNKLVLTNKKYNEIWHISAPGLILNEQNCPGKFFHLNGRPYLEREIPIVRSVRWGETVANEEILCQRQDGSWIVVICNSAPILDREGKLVAGVVVFSDITELKEATTKAALAKQLQQIIEFLPDGTFVVDHNRKVIAWNRALELLTGMSKDDIIGTDFYKGIFNDCNQKSLIDQIFVGISSNCSNSGANQTGEAAVQQILIPRLNHKENVLLDLKATPIRNEQGDVTGVIETIRDITHQKQMEAEAIRMQKLDSLGIMAGGIAHDFNNILAGILANLQLAEFKLKHHEDIFKYLDDTIETTWKASQITRQFLTFAKGGAPVKKIASILELITDAVEFALRGSKVKPRFHFQENPWTVEIDEGQITQVINNLTINAVQAMSSGGFLDITFENIVLSPESKYRPGRYVKLSIKDSGCGIPLAIIDKIFDPFFTTKKVGNGLGLSTSYSIIKKHDGYIEVESTAGTGTTFYIYLPASEEEIARLEASREIKTTGGYNILLMDDDEIIRQVVGDMLAYYGYRITIARDGNETIQCYQQAMSAGEGFDAVLMDLTVPGGMGGLETMAVLRRIDPLVKAIISSGYANDPVMSDYKQYGFCGFVAKPYKFDELVEVLNTVIQKKQ
jgi:PAS domain S-box-containing protein